jgi:signal transduction histidine kinase/CheY-like chemotaxis protein
MAAGVAAGLASALAVTWGAYHLPGGGVDGAYLLMVLPVLAVTRLLGWREALAAVAAGSAAVCLGPVPAARETTAAGVAWTAVFAATGAAVALTGRAAATAERTHVCRERQGEFSDRLRRLIDADMIPMALRRAGGRRAGEVAEANDSWLALVGRERAELEAGGLRWDQVVPPAARAAERLAARAVAAADGYGPYQTTYVRADGRVVPVTVYLVRVDARDVLAVCLDVSEQAAAADRLRTRAADLTAADRRKDEALAMLAHELRGPLAPIVNATDILRRRGGNPADLAKWVGVIEASVAVLVRLVDDLLDVARIQHGKVDLDRQVVDLCELVRAAADAARPLMAERRHQLYLGLPPDGRAVYASVDPRRLTQVVGNLLTNAARYTPPGGTVEVAVARDGADAVVSVRDDGEGLSPDAAEHIWEPFFQCRVPGEAMDRPVGGLGLGLTLVRRLVEQHGGRVGVRSDGPGRGSTFEARVPAQTAAWEVFRRDPPAPDRPPARRVLVVDDEYVIAESTAETLRLDGHTVNVVHDGEAALAAVGALSPDVTLLDIGLPGLDGFEVARRMRAAGVGGTLVAVTGYAGHGDRDTGREAGFDHYLPKPVHPDALRAILAAPRPQPPAAA